MSFLPVIDALKTSTLYQKACLILHLTALVFHTVGFSCPNWAHDGRNNSGLWRRCQFLLFRTFCFEVLSQDDVEGWLRATQFFETVGLIAIAVAAVILFLSLIVQSLRNKKIVTIVNALACFVAFGTIIVGAIIFASRSNSSYLSWAFALCIVGAILEGVAGALILVGTFATRS
ncbi:uncharacterized protein LOC124139478 isoform X1 [Haliotis rufescens]|uniref:uncharacterized protein LOC124139478 isoform X1 n=1 Tax=Haliotis rufescens TaxID=6454 RepID=UPI00201E8FAF|nr:uncharacterized protein LOC124139478 isoform X1 [Haliotis rufescens]